MANVTTRRPRSAATASRIFKHPIVRELDSGVTAKLRDSDLRHAARSIADLCEGEHPDAVVHVPVKTLRLHEAAARTKLLEQLAEAGVDLAPFHLPRRRVAA